VEEGLHEEEEEGHVRTRLKANIFEAIMSCGDPSAAAQYPAGVGPASVNNTLLDWARTRHWVAHWLGTT
jgi:hypothetical protein